MEQYLAIGPIIVSTRKFDGHEKTGAANSGGTWVLIQVVKVSFPCLTRYTILHDLSPLLSRRLNFSRRTFIS